MFREAELLAKAAWKHCTSTTVSRLELRDDPSWRDRPLRRGLRGPRRRRRASIAGLRAVLGPRQGQGHLQLVRDCTDITDLREVEDSGARAGEALPRGFWRTRLYAPSILRSGGRMACRSQRYWPTSSAFLAIFARLSFPADLELHPDDAGQRPITCFQPGRRCCPVTRRRDASPQGWFRRLDQLVRFVQPATPRGRALIHRRHRGGLRRQRRGRASCSCGWSSIRPMTLPSGWTTRTRARPNCPRRIRAQGRPGGVPQAVVRQLPPRASRTRGRRAGPDPSHGPRNAGLRHDPEHAGQPAEVGAEPATVQARLPDAGLRPAAAETDQIVAYLKTLK